MAETKQTQTYWVLFSRGKPPSHLLVGPFANHEEAKECAIVIKNEVNPFILPIAYKVDPIYICAANFKDLVDQLIDCGASKFVKESLGLTLGLKSI